MVHALPAPLSNQGGGVVSQRRATRRTGGLEGLISAAKQATENGQDAAPDYRVKTDADGGAGKLGVDVH